MPRATLDPKNGTYKLSRPVPEDVRRLVGGPAVVSFTLWRRDPGEVVAEFRKRDAGLEARWAEVRGGRQCLDHETVEPPGDEVYHDLLARSGGTAASGSATGMRISLDLQAPRKGHGRRTRGGFVAATGGPSRPQPGPRLLDACGMVASRGYRGALLLAAYRAGRQAADVNLRQVGGDHVPDPGAQRFPMMPTVREPDGKGELDAVWAAWTRDAKPNPKIVERWRPVLGRMVDFAGTSHLGGVCDAMLQDWSGPSWTP